MSENIWWAEESWWEKKSIQLGFFSGSPRQLLTLVTFTLIGYLLSLPLNVPIAEVSFGGKAGVLLGFALLGYVISARRVKLIPLELQLLYYLTNRSDFRKMQVSNTSKQPKKDDCNQK